LEIYLNAFFFSRPWRARYFNGFFSKCNTGIGAVFGAQGFQPHGATLAKNGVLPANHQGFQTRVNKKAKPFMTSPCM
jgi:hypothetical protein